MSLLTTVWGQTQADLVEKVKSVYEGKADAKLSDVWYSKGGSTEDLEMFSGWVEKNKDKGWEVAVRIKGFDEKKPDGFPAPINGRARVALAKPTHWVYISCKRSTSSGSKYMTEFHFGCASIDGKWQIVGTKFADEPGKKQQNCLDCSP